MLNANMTNYILSNIPYKGGSRHLKWGTKLFRDRAVQIDRRDAAMKLLGAGVEPHLLTKKFYIIAIYEFNDKIIIFYMNTLLMRILKTWIIQPANCF